MAQYKTWTNEYRLLQAARSRSAKTGRECNIELKDIHIPNYCPVLGVKLERAKDNTDSSPSIDRIDSTKGYTPDNIAVISWRANMLKNNMTVEEARLLLAYLERGK